MLDLFLWLYITIGGLYAIWFVVKHCPNLRTKGEQLTLTLIVFALWPVIWSGVAWDWIKARWRRRSLVIR